MALCRSLGCTLSELWTRMTAGEMRLWRAAWAERPWGSDLMEMMLAKLCSLLVACHGQDAKVADYMITPPRPQRAPNWREIRHKISEHQERMKRFAR